MDDRPNPVALTHRVFWSDTAPAPIGFASGEASFGGPPLQIGFAEFEPPVLPGLIGFADVPPSPPVRRIGFADPAAPPRRRIEFVEPAAARQPRRVEFAEVPPSPLPQWIDFAEDAVLASPRRIEFDERSATGVDVVLDSAADIFDGFAATAEIPVPAREIEPTVVSEPAAAEPPPGAFGPAIEQELLPALPYEDQAEPVVAALPVPVVMSWADPEPTPEVEAEPERRGESPDGGEAAESSSPRDAAATAPSGLAIVAIVSGEPGAEAAAMPEPGSTVVPHPAVAAAVATGYRRAALRRRIGAHAAWRKSRTVGLAAVILVALGALRLDQMSGHEEASPVAPPVVVPLPAAPAAAIGDPLERDLMYLGRAQAGDPEAQYQVAMIYAKGIQHYQDLPRAAAWFKKAAAAGVADAQYNLATLYERGLGVPRDMQTALSWYRRAAAQNHPFAEHNLAVAYAEGRGTPQNLPLAAKLFQQAAEQGIVPAMVNLAILYQQGKGVATSLVDSYAWYRAAAQRGDAEAEKRAAALFQQFSEADRPLAQAIAVAVAERIHAPPRPAGAARADADHPIAERIQASPVLASGLGAPSPEELDLAPTEQDAADAEPPPAVRPRFVPRQPRPAPVPLNAPEVRF
jgi:TPR repeat protein